MEKQRRRFITISDSHACIDEVIDLLDKLAFDPNVDEVCSLGDEIDRGPDGLAVVRLFRKLGIQSIGSNHTAKLPRFFAHEKVLRETGRKNPMNVSDARKAEWLRFEQEDVDWIAALPPYLRIPELNLLCVHGGFERLPLAKQNPKTITMVRYVDRYSGLFKSYHGEPSAAPPELARWYEEWSEPYSVVCGHNVVSLDEPKVYEKEAGGRKIRIFSSDTGCCFGGRLTATVFTPSDNEYGHDYSFVQVQARKKYWDLHGSRE